MDKTEIQSIFTATCISPSGTNTEHITMKQLHDINHALEMDKLGRMCLQPTMSTAFWSAAHQNTIFHARTQDICWKMDGTEIQLNANNHVLEMDKLERMLMIGYDMTLPVQPTTSATSWSAAHQNTRFHPGKNQTGKSQTGKNQTRKKSNQEKSNQEKSNQEKSNWESTNCEKSNNK